MDPAREGHNLADMRRAQFVAMMRSFHVSRPILQSEFRVWNLQRTRMVPGYHLFSKTFLFSQPIPAGPFREMLQSEEHLTSLWHDQHTFVLAVDEILNSNGFGIAIAQVDSLASF